LTFTPYSTQTILELFACISLTLRYSLDIAGVFKNYDYSSQTTMAFCILLHSAWFVVAMNGATACLVVITLDRYWKIVYPVHHRKRYRRWMMRVGLFLPWLNGVATQFVPKVFTTKVVDGSCDTAAFRMEVRSVTLCGYKLSVLVRL